MKAIKIFVFFITLIYVFNLYLEITKLNNSYFSDNDLKRHQLAKRKNLDYDFRPKYEVVEQQLSCPMR